MFAIIVWLSSSNKSGNYDIAVKLLQRRKVPITHPSTMKKLYNVHYTTYQYRYNFLFYQQNWIIFIIKCRIYIQFIPVYVVHVIFIKFYLVLNSFVFIYIYWSWWCSCFIYVICIYLHILELMMFMLYLCYLYSSICK
jgi:hypothetical protein